MKDPEIQPLPLVEKEIILVSQFIKPLSNMPKQLHAKKKKKMTKLLPSRPLVSFTNN